jgi:hypothetical protein
MSDEKAKSGLVGANTGIARRDSERDSGRVCFPVAGSVTDKCCSRQARSALTVERLVRKVNGRF